MLDTDVAIETPEHIVFDYRVAGPARRAVAYLIDIIICYGIVFVIGVCVLIALLVAGAEFSDASDSMQEAIKASVGFFLVLLFLAQWGYFTALEAWRGASIGKSALSLRVVTLEGRPIGFGAALLRNLLRTADWLPVGNLGGVLSMTLTKRFQRLGDVVAGTMVVVTERAQAARPIMLRPPARPDELAEIPDEVRLDPEERAAFELFLRRDHALGTARRDELADLLEDMLRKKFGIRKLPPARAIALLYDQAINAGRADGPASSRGPSFQPGAGPSSWR